MVRKRWKRGLASFQSYEVDVASVVEAAVVDPFVYGIGESVDGSADEPRVVVVT